MGIVLCVFLSLSLHVQLVLVTVSYRRLRRWRLRNFPVTRHVYNQLAARTTSAASRGSGARGIVWLPGRASYPGLSTIVLVNMLLFLLLFRMRISFSAYPATALPSLYGVGGPSRTSPVPLPWLPEDSKGWVVPAGPLWGPYPYRLWGPYPSGHWGLYLLATGALTLPVTVF